MITTLNVLHRHALGAAIGALLLACAAPVSAPVNTPTNIPMPQAAADGALAQADDYYALGRSRFAAGQTAAALAAYRRALALDPAHVGAHNGVAVLYAGEGDYAGAIAIWSALTAAGEAAPARPAAAYLFGNLGYAYLLAGDAGRAVAALSQACLLDPFDARAWTHLGAALGRAGEAARAAQALQQAEALRLHDVRADHALLAEHLAAPAAAVVSAPLPRLEISNGNGVRGMAASLGRTLRDGDGGQAWGALRLTNAGHFRLATSRIEYRPEQEAAARRLAQQLGATTRMQLCRCERADVRLVLGRDLLDPAALRRHYLWQLAQARQALAALRGS
jgi:Flp pilus assembly protein TadD